MWMLQLVAMLAAEAIGVLYLMRGGDDSPV